MEPIMTLSPSTSPYSKSFTSLSSSHSKSFTSLSSSPQTTPKLSKRERLASFSRLIASENFLELLPTGRTGGARRQGKYKGRSIILESLPSDVTLKDPTDRNTLSECGLKGYLESNSLAFSPNFLRNRTSKYTSPSYKYPTPTKSPLYTTNRKGLFLGRGSFGNVMLCTYKENKYAVKITRQTSSFIGEKNLLGISHPHLVSILHISQMADKVFICMEFAGHCNLQQVLDTKSELDFARRLSFCIQIISGLRHCHQRRIVHCDVKPANVIVSPHGICKLGDFGHSIDLGSSPVSEAGSLPDVIGTVAYAAPEVLRGSLPSTASDVFSFGILLWQVKTREFPWSGDHPHIIIYKVANYGSRPEFPEDEDCLSENYSQIVKQCWCEEPDERVNASEILIMLRAIAQEIKKK